MAIICREHKLIYIQVPGTGCSVVSNVLLEHLNGEMLGRKHNDINEVLVEGLLSEADLEKYLIAANVRNPFDRLVTLYQRVRGDWATEQLNWAYANLESKKSENEISSEFYEKKIEELSSREKRIKRGNLLFKFIGFNTWLYFTLTRWRIRDKNRQPDIGTYRYIHHLFPLLSKVDVVLFQDNLEGTLNSLLKTVGHNQHIELPRKNRTHEKKHYSSYYNEFMIKHLSNTYEMELALMGYRMEGNSNCDNLLYIRENKKKILRTGGH